jgi:hypothetical protein
MNNGKVVIEAEERHSSAEDLNQRYSMNVISVRRVMKMLKIVLQGPSCRKPKRQSLQ